VENNFTFEVVENGYYILNNGVKTYHQYEPHIPYRKESYALSAQAHIEELIKEASVQERTIPIESRIEVLEEMINELLLGGM